MPASLEEIISENLQNLIQVGEITSRAKEWNIDKGDLSKWRQHGKLSLPTLQRLSELLHVTACDLISKRESASAGSAAAPEKLSELLVTSGLNPPPPSCPNHGVCAMTSQLLRLLADGVGRYAAEPSEHRRVAFQKAIEGAALLLQEPLEEVKQRSDESA